MKKNILIAAFVLFAGIAKAEQVYQNEALMSLPPTESGSEEARQTDAVCSAWTQCWNGQVIRCAVAGDYCTWSYRAGQYVDCQARNINGAWVRYWFTCY